MELRYTRLVLKFKSPNVLILPLTQMYKRERLFLFSEFQCLIKSVFAALSVSGRNQLHAVGGAATLKIVSSTVVSNRLQPQRKCGFLLRSSYQVNTVRGCFQQFHYSQETSGCFVFSKSRCENRFKKMKQHL